MKTIKILILIIFATSFACVNQTANNTQNSNESQMMNTENQENISNINDVTKTKASSDTLSVALTLFRDNKESIVSSSETFIKDDGIRLNISVVEKGFMLVIYKGSSGKEQIIFPNKDFYEGKNEIEPNKTITIPSKGWFFFDEKEGVEKLFVIYSEKQDLSDLTENPKETVKKLEQTEAEKNEAEAFEIDGGKLVQTIKLKHK